MVAGEGEYRPWMLVEQKSRRGNLKGAKKRNNLKKGDYLGSRFHTLADLEASSLEQESSKNPQSTLVSTGKEILLNSDVNVDAGRKVVGNSFVKTNPNGLVGKTQKGQARIPKSKNATNAHSSGVSKKGLEKSIVFIEVNSLASYKAAKAHRVWISGP
ncbi:hypothetical protein PVK06_008047 [Gossypium arboreum]|uniref:Uncharacterized protein n=1 Tax=Gossypium arboreum TaxID=29729 RepID=A0ABR0QJP4_GOSAR|nr:hypothetical protein PVK06_008047 [Gossypium arboreum]